MSTPFFGAPLTTSLISEKEYNLLKSGKLPNVANDDPRFPHRYSQFCNIPVAREDSQFSDLLICKQSHTANRLGENTEMRIPRSSSLRKRCCGELEMTYIDDWRRSTGLLLSTEARRPAAPLQPIVTPVMCG